MEPKVVSHETMPKPLGPYSQVVRLGDVLYVAGQPGIDPATGDRAAGGFEAEARQAFANLEAALVAAGSGLDRTVKVTVFMADAGDFPAMNELFREYFPSNPPARSTPVVALPRGLLGSIDAIAAA